MALVSSSDLVQKEWDAITLPEPFRSLIGTPTPAFYMTIHGPQGSGKSTFALGLAYGTVPHAIIQDGATLYVSAEEGHGSTLADKAQRLGANHPRLVFSDAQTTEAIKEEIQETDAKHVFIDSGNRVDPSSKTLIELLEWCQEREISLVFVLRERKDGQYKGDSALAYDPQTVIRCFNNEQGDERARTLKNRHEEAPREISIPMVAAEIGDPVDYETARRENPNCENWGDKPKPVQKKCKAMFAKLHESGEYDPEEIDGTDVGKTETPQGEAAKANEPASDEDSESDVSEGTVDEKEGDESVLDKADAKMDELMNELQKYV